LETGALHSGADPLARVLDGDTGQARQRERRESATDVCLDGERIPANPHDGDTDDLPVHDRATLAPATDTSCSERVLEDLHVRGTTSEPHAGDVEPHIAMSHAGCGEERLGELTELATLRPRDGLVPAAEGNTRAR